jgi:alkylation response protein AidB-like acyl-CoA dehydrogenase
MTVSAQAEEATAPDWREATDRICTALAARAASHDADDSFVTENYALLKREGFFTAHIPPELGGGGLSHAEMCGLVRRLATACSSTALAFAMHTHIVSVAAWRWRNENAPTDALLRRVAKDGLVLVSSGGSDWLQSAGQATKVEGGFRITARKIFSSGCLGGDLLVTSAVHDDATAGPTVLHFAVPLKGQGVKILDTWRALGMRGTGSHDVELTDVFVADAAISGRRPQGKWHPLFHTISLLAFPIIYAAYVGVAERARAVSLAMARKKTPDATLLQLIGEMENAFASMTLAHERMVTLAAQERPGQHATNQAMIARTLAGRAAIRTVECAMEVAGGASFYRDAGLERAFRDVQASRFHPLQEKPQQLLAGRVALGLDIDG